MAQSLDNTSSALQLSLNDPRLRRYLFTDLENGRNGYSLQSIQPIQAFVHLAAARYTVATYVPRLLLHQLLDERLNSPWLSWVDGSLLFADLSGSTALAERLSMLGREGIELVTAFLNDVFVTMIRVIRDYGGDLVSFGGDALLVFFGDDRHPRTAVRAAMALQDALHGYVRAVPGIGEFPMHLHVGVESGRVAFVSAGRGQAQYYSVLGAAVNRVAAAEGHAGPSEVVVGPQAWEALTTFAEGQEVAPGFWRVMRVAPPQRPHEPFADEPPITDPPEVAIPRLLDELDRVSPYIPEQLLRRILANPEQPQIEADLRPVTVLFGQVAGLEVLAEQLPPEQAAQAVQIYVEVVQTAIEQFGGVINKLDVAEEGIKLVAFFGAPIAYEDHTERAAQAALAMRDQFGNVLQRLAQEVFQSDDVPFTIQQRIGLNLGAVFAGNVGSVERKEYTVMGDAVNVAARVMSKATWGEVWCSAAVAQAIDERLQCDPRGSLALKGKAVPLPLFRLVGERDLSVGPISNGPLIGRVEQLTWLQTHLQAALAGQGRAVRIVGEAGVGKSRLVSALLDQALAAHARVLRAVCFSYNASTPYSAWAEWLKALCGFAAGDNDSVRERKLVTQLAELGPGMEEWLPLLGDLARLDIADNRLTRGLDPQMRQTRRFELLEQMLLHTAQAGPVVVVFEDMHWADSISVDLWRRVAGHVAGHAVLLLGIHRPSESLPIADETVQVLELQELSAEESAALAKALVGDAPLPPTLINQLVQRASGNPLFLAELLDAVRQKVDAATPQLAANVLEDLPDSLSGLLLARIDRLDTPSRNLLRIASVIGLQIPFRVLQSIQRADEQVLVQQLLELDMQQITVQERVRPERIHSFRHTLLQEVAYQSLLYARRRELHGRIGDYIERSHAHDLDDYYGLLAHHYRHSDRLDKAITYLLKAGHAARDVYANEEAMQYYRWALELLEPAVEDTRVWEARDALGDVLATVGRYDEALAQHAAILAASQVTPDVKCRAYRKRGSVLEKQGQYVAALEELEQAMAIVRSGAPDLSPLALPLICADIALVRKRRGEYDLAIQACEEGLQAVRRDPRSRDDELIEARLHSELGGIFGMRGDYPRAQMHFERSLRARESIDDLPGIIFSHNNLGYLWQLQSEYERALEHYRVAEELARKINLRYTLVFAANNAAYALISLGAYAEARKRCDEALVLSKDMKDQQNIAQIHNTLGVIAYHQGDYEQALEDYHQALEINRQLGSAYQEANTLMNMAVSLNAMGAFDDAIAHATYALERAEALHATRLKAEAMNALAEALLAKGDCDAALQYAQQAVELSTEIGSRYDQGIARRLLGQVLAAQGAPFDAEFQASLALLEGIKDSFELARTWAAYGKALASIGNESLAQTYLKSAQDTFVLIGAGGELQQLASHVERSV